MRSDIQEQNTNQRPAVKDCDIRPATPLDKNEAAELIYQPMGSLADYLFGVCESINARSILAQLFEGKSNRFSHQFADVLEVDSEIAGIVLAYPAQIVQTLALPTGKQLFRILGVEGMRRLLTRTRAFASLKETEPDEYYIYTLSVFPKFQNRKLGRELLENAEAKATAAGFSKYALGVTIGNERARVFYERCGYAVVETFHTPSLEDEIGHKGYYRMVKLLPSSS